MTAAISSPTVGRGSPLKSAPHAVDAAGTTVQFGVSRHLNLADESAGMSVGLTGSAAFLSPEAAGDKLVLHMLSAPS